MKKLHNTNEKIITLDELLLNAQVKFTELTKKIPRYSEKRGLTKIHSFSNKESIVITTDSKDTYGVTNLSKTIPERIFR